MANLTIAIDRTLLRRARGKAMEQGTSLNALIRQYLEDFAGTSSAEVGLRMLVDLGRRTEFTLGDEGIAWTRDELHDRANLR